MTRARSSARLRSLRHVRSFPKLFGVRHLGSIRGVVTLISVASTAFGPVALSLGHDVTDSYVEVLRLLLVLPVAVAILGLVAPAPRAPVAAEPGAAAGDGRRAR